MKIEHFTDQVLCADCLTTLPCLPPESVGLVVTDPPYLVRYHDRSGRSIVNDDSADFLAPAFAAIYRVLKPGGFCVSFYGWGVADLFITAWRNAGFQLIEHLVWTKRYASSVRFAARRHEQAYMLAKGEPLRPRKIFDDVLPWQYTGNRLHPTQKPVEGLTPLIAALSMPGEVVLDPFCGSGSTLVAARQLGRRYLGIEIDPAYCQAAKGRLASEE